jgi:hypothetical protein
MRAPSTKILIGVAIVSFVLAPCFISDYYPASHPVVGPDGSVLHGTDGKVLFHRDMTLYYKMMVPSYILFLCSAVSIIWLLVRLLKFLFGRVANHKNET